MMWPSEPEQAAHALGQRSRQAMCAGDMLERVHANRKAGCLWGAGLGEVGERENGPYFLHSTLVCIYIYIFSLYIHTYICSHLQTT